MNNLLSINTASISTLDNHAETNFQRPLGVITNPSVDESLSAAERFATKAKNCLNTQELLNEAGMNWKVITKELYTPEGLLVPNKAIVREDTGKLLGVVGSTYTPVQNEEALGFFNDFLNTGAMKLETAGSIAGGKRVFIQAKILGTESRVIGDDTVENYVTIGKAHDGSMGLNIGFTPIRMFCLNQMNAVTQNAESRMLRFRHTPKIHDNMEQVAAILALAEKDFAATLEQYRYLASVDINSAAQLEEYVKLVFAGENYKELEAQGKTPASKIITNVFELFETGRGSDKTANTYWKAYNAINEYLNYERGNDDAKRFDSLSFGDSKQKDLRALSVAIRLTA